MASRNVKAQCSRCGCTWRMARTWFDSAERLGGLRCPVCCAEAAEGDGLDDEARGLIREIVVGVAELAAPQIRLMEEARREKLRARRRRNGLGR